MTNIAITTVTVKSFKVIIPGVGYQIHKGFALARVDNGEIFSSDGVIPHFFRTKKIAASLIADGLTQGAKFVKAQ
jgi:hypothetical protein